MKTQFITKYLTVLISLLCYVFLYYVIDRSEFLFLISGISILGGVYFYWLKTNPFSITEIIGIAIILRIALLFATPNFSDDFNRFLWDGEIIRAGENPYENNPSFYYVLWENFNPENPEKIKELDHLKGLYHNLNSKGYYTVYPPVNQAIFSSSVYLGGSNVFYSVLWMKVFILLFEIGLIFLLFKMLRKLKMKESLAQIYALNPLVILELTGNVHFEGVMLFFFMLGLYSLLYNRIVLSGLAIALAINTKIVPLLFLPLFLPLLGMVKSIKLYVTIGVLSLLMVVPFISDIVVNNFSQSLELYFQSFEFNASFYYLFKGISYAFLDYKTSVIGDLIPIIVFLFGMFMTYKLYIKKANSDLTDFDLKSFVSYAIPLMFVFYLLASTIHPWYVINLVILCVFIKNRAILIWSILIFLSYFAYSNYINENHDGNFHNSFWYYFIVTIQYSIVLFFYIFERRKTI
ncbi:MAG: hypothetical protein ACPGVD_07115 [Flavobacteriales bacterium]